MNPQLAQALLRARLTGQPVSVNVGGMIFVAHPNGMLGTPGGQGYGGNALQQPQAAMLPTPPMPPAGAAPTQTPLYWTGSDPGNQLPAASRTATDLLNPQPVYAGPPFNTAAAAPTTLPVPPVPAPGTSPGPVSNMLPGRVNPYPAAAPTLAARRYRGLHGMTASDDAETDRLNALSLQAAQQGRNYWNPQFAGPAFMAPNLLQMPPANAAAPIMLGQTGAAPTNVNFLANQQAQQLQQGGLY